jgi:hypothetical protein
VCVCVCLCVCVCVCVCACECVCVCVQAAVRSEKHSVMSPASFNPVSNPPAVLSEPQGGEREGTVL